MGGDSPLERVLELKRMCQNTDWDVQYDHFWYVKYDHFLEVKYDWIQEYVKLKMTANFMKFLLIVRGWRHSNGLCLFWAGSMSRTYSDECQGIWNGIYWWTFSQYILLPLIICQVGQIWAVTYSSSIQFEEKTLLICYKLYLHFCQWSFYKSTMCIALQSQFHTFEMQWHDFCKMFG